MTNSADTTAHLSYPLTTWLRSPSTLCQRASLCPAETQKNKNQQTTKEVTGGTELFEELDRCLRPSKCFTTLSIYGLNAQQAPTPLLVPQTSRVHGPVIRLKQHKSSVYFSEIYSVIFSFFSKLPHLSSKSLNHRHAT